MWESSLCMVFIWIVAVKNDPMEKGKHLFTIWQTMVFDWPLNISLVWLWAHTINSTAPFHCSVQKYSYLAVESLYNALSIQLLTFCSTHSHPFQVSLPNPRTLSHKSSFIPRTCNLWNVSPSSYFPESYNLPSFKTKMNKFDQISLSPVSLSLSSFLLCWDFV